MAAGFLLFSERKIPIFYSASISSVIANEDHQTTLKTNLELSVDANLQMGIGVISALTQQFFGSGLEVGLKVTPPIGIKSILNLNQHNPN